MDDRGDRAGCPAVARRTVLFGAGAAGLATLLAACGDEPDSPSGASGDPVDGPATDPTGATDEPEEIDPSAKPFEDAPPEGALAAVEEVPEGGGVVVDGDILVVQLRAGQFRAYDARCPHQSTVVYEPDSAGVILCPGHNSHFRASDGGRIDGPASRGLRTIRVRVSRGYVVRA